jgi:hypothetical protein
MYSEDSKTIFHQEVAKAIADAAVAAAKLVASTADDAARVLAATKVVTLEARVTLIENNLEHMEKEIKKGNAVADEILEIVKFTKVTGKVIQWVIGIGAACATIATAWHWYK